MRMSDGDGLGCRWWTVDGGLPRKSASPAHTGKPVDGISELHVPKELFISKTKIQTEISVSYWISSLQCEGSISYSNIV
jgi:hypothetical protein